MVRRPGPCDPLCVDVVDLWEAVRYSDRVVRIGRARFGWMRRTAELVGVSVGLGALTYGSLFFSRWWQVGTGPEAVGLVAMILCLTAAAVVSLFWAIAVIRLLRPPRRILGVVAVVLYFAGIAGMAGTVALTQRLTGRTAHCQVLTVPQHAGWSHYTVRCPGEDAVLSVAMPGRDDAAVNGLLRYHPGGTPEAVPQARLDQDGGIVMVRIWQGVVGVMAVFTALALLAGLVRVARGRPGWDADHEL